MSTIEFKTFYVKVGKCNVKFHHLFRYILYFDKVYLLSIRSLLISNILFLKKKQSINIFKSRLFYFYSMKKYILYLFTLTITSSFAQLHTYVNPMIGSEDEGNVYVGASLPFGMVKPGPDCDYQSNSGHVAIAKSNKLLGVSHTHVSGTGGGPKYGNILLCPMPALDTASNYAAHRKSENAIVGKYQTVLANSNIAWAVTSSHSVAFHQINFHNPDSAWLKLDLGHYLGKSKEANGESQMLVGSELEVMSPTHIRGYTRVKGGWNRGAAYTVYFYAEFSLPFQNQLLIKDNQIVKNTKLLSDNNSDCKAYLDFGKNKSKDLKIKLAISFVSTGKAQENLTKEVPHWDFDKVLNDAQQAWEKTLQTITVQTKNKDRLIQFYTALYHTCLIPSDRTGENPHWKSDQPYYDDFYAIWDTYRTNFPLLTLMDKDRVLDIVKALLDIYKHTGFLPDARSGNDNGLTQGGSNTDIVIADAFVKKITGIDYDFALKAMINNAENDPGAFHRKIGRGGLIEYNQKGYVSYSHERSCTRTVEYSMCDNAIATVAAGMGKNEVAKKYRTKSESWKNLWRDTIIDGTRGFIWPRDDKGKWLDTTEQAKFSNVTWKFVKGTHLFTPKSFGWGWEDVFYEGNSHHYSLHLLHDIPSMIARSGGSLAFEKRLDTFFGKDGDYDVSNEPCFFTPVLYHYIGKPWKSNAVANNIVSTKYNSTPSGLPGNDDSGSMSSWYAFHTIGLYPNAGHDYYLITAPQFEEVKISNGEKPFVIKSKFKNANAIYIASAKLNGKPYNNSWVKHHIIAKGGLVELEISDKPNYNWGVSVPEE